ncbi:MAG TPA: c-type cytochrome, partial [Flavobacteriaceae bacterium]|nr:c-type cytochrome [Flavobacteriaceae bacterium]
MKKPNTFWIVLVLTCTSFFFVNGQEGEAIFKQNCAACHKLGKRFIGPDLIGVNQKRSEDWLLSFIKSSQTMIKSGDADAVAIYEEFNQVMMTDLAHLSDDDIKTILSYIEQQSSSMNSTEEPVEIVEVVPTIYSAEDIQKGQNLFSGKTRFSNGGASCISCHNVTNDELISGGLMAKDLTNAYARMGEAGVGSIISSPPFPVMATAYEK